ncbi:MAG TPA: cupin domain-containing protein [Phycisphaerales bacterium]|nr:cupin domain-containing protein [Phycisphaerales bacterium]
MLIRRAEEMAGTPMQMEGVKGVTMRLMVGRADGAPTFSMRHFTVEPGGHTPHHQHNYEHEVFILEGEGLAEEDGTHYPVRAGDVLFVRPNVLHQFVNTAPPGGSPLKFLCLVPVSFDCGGGMCQPTPGS